MAMNIGGNNPYTGIVSGKELEEVSKAIFGSASKLTSIETGSDVSKLDISKFNRISYGIDLFERNTSIQQTKDIAINKAGIGIELSQDATKSLNFLRTEAAKLNTVNIYKAEAERANINIFTEAAAAKTSQALNTTEMSKDKEGSNPFTYVFVSSKNNENKKEEQNVSIFS